HRHRSHTRRHTHTPTHAHTHAHTTGDSNYRKQLANTLERLKLFLFTPRLHSSLSLHLITPSSLSLFSPHHSIISLSLSLSLSLSPIPSLSLSLSLSPIYSLSL